MAAPLAEARDIVIDGKRLETLRYSSGGRDPTLVMLHEGLGSVAMWRDFPEQVAKHTRSSVLVYSRYGHGKSERLAGLRTADFMHHEAKVVLPELLDRLQIQQPILLGHSDGGSIALIYAGSWPHRVRGLILEAPHLFVEGICVESIMKIGELYRGGDLATRFRRYHEHPDEMFWGWHNIWIDPEFRSWNIEKYLEAIGCPVLVIQGQDDEYGTLAQVAAIKARLPETESLILANCGHCPHRDQPRTTLEAIEEFVSKILRKGDEKN